LTGLSLVCIFTLVGGELSPADLKEMNGCVCFALRRATRAVTQFYDRALKRHRLRATQFPILVAASGQESVPLADMAGELGMDRTTLLRNVRPLVRRRLVRVEPAADSRRTEIRATAAGHALLARVYPDWKRAQVQALQSLEGLEWSRSLDTLSRMARTAAR
jgi:DNA-binding MarR family transcriptional regulator